MVSSKGKGTQEDDCKLRRLPTLTTAMSAPATKKTSAHKPRVDRPERPIEVSLPYLHKSLASQIKEGHLAKAVKTTDKSE